MKTYTRFPLQKDEWQLASCVQSVLKRRERFLEELPSQEQIASFFEQSRFGLRTNAIINLFLEEYDICSDYKDPYRKNFSLPIFLGGINDSEDVLAFFDGGSFGNFGLVCGYDYCANRKAQDLVTLHVAKGDKPVLMDARHLVDRMELEGVKENCFGFYVIGERR
ncbi:MAG: hypothetical protein WCP89_00025 [archaeon]